MRWWVRLIVTLILAPLLWRLGVAYLASEQGTTWNDLAQQSGNVLASVYLTFTLPALVLCAILLVADLILHWLGLDLLSVIVSPLLAWPVAAAMLYLAQGSGVQAHGGAILLAVVYGLVWGLTIREPRARRPNRRGASAAGPPPGAVGR